MHPPEIVLPILEDVYYTEGKVDYVTLRACSLVCRAWYAAVQSLFVKVVVLRRTIPTHLLPHASNIRVLSVGIGYNMISPSKFASIFIACSQLYELGIWACSFRYFEKDVMQTLSLSPPPFRALRMKEMGRESLTPFQLLSLTSSVRHLRIHSPWNTTPPDERTKHKLYELSTFGNLNRDILSWLLSQSVGSLQLFETMYREPSRRTMRTVMKKHAPYIRSLRMLYDFPHRADEVIACCPSLEELVLKVVSIVPTSNLPRSITHLVLINRHPCAPYSEFEPLLQVIEGLSNLRMLTCDKNIIKVPDRPKLKTSCMKRNVELVWHVNEQWHKEEEMIPNQRYPRLRSFSNLRLMV